MTLRKALVLGDTQELEQLQSGDVLDPICTKYIGSNYTLKALTYVDSPYSIPEDEDIMYINSTGGNVSVELPATGRVKNIKWGAGTNVVTVTVANDGTIDGAESFIFNEQYDTGSSITVINNGTGVWYII